MLTFHVWFIDTWKRGKIGHNSMVQTLNRFKGEKKALLRAGPAEQRELKGKIVGKNCRRQKKCQCLEEYWRTGLFFFFLGGRNLNEVTQRNCVECERAQELRTKGQRLGKPGMFQQSRWNFLKRKWLITSNLQKDQNLRWVGTPVGTFKKNLPTQKDQNWERLCTLRNVHSISSEWSAGSEVWLQWAQKASSGVSESKGAVQTTPERIWLYGEEQTNGSCSLFQNLRQSTENFKTNTMKKYWIE